MTGLPKFWFRQPRKLAVMCGNFQQYSAAGDEKFLYRAYIYQMNSAPAQNQRDERDYWVSKRGCVMRDCRIERNITVYIISQVGLNSGLRPLLLLRKGGLLLLLLNCRFLLILLLN